jgi:predicted Zn-dependent protease
MSQSRIDVFTKMAEAQPDNEMVWYGLANEYTKLGRWADAARALRQVIRVKPDFTAAYQMLGAALAAVGEREEARRVWREGVAVAERTGAWKARQHLEGLLAGSADTSSAGGFCDE